MKKSISILVLLVLLSLGAFAQEFSLSAGGGIQFDLGIPIQDGVDGVGYQIGGFGFFDATYGELDVAFGYYGQTEYELGGLNLSFSLLGKYPFYVGPVTLSPLAGARLNLPLTASYNGNKVDDFNTMDNANIDILTGVGVDTLLGSSIYLRTQALLTFGFKQFGAPDELDTLQSIGPTIKVGIGYKF